MRHRSSFTSRHICPNAAPPILVCRFLSLSLLFIFTRFLQSLIQCTLPVHWGSSEIAHVALAMIWSTKHLQPRSNRSPHCGNAQFLRLLHSFSPSLPSFDRTANSSFPPPFSPFPSLCLRPGFAVSDLIQCTCHCTWNLSEIAHVAFAMA